MYGLVQQKHQVTELQHGHAQQFRAYVALGGRFLEYAGQRGIVSRSARAVLVPDSDSRRHAVRTWVFLLNKIVISKVNCYGNIYIRGLDTCERVPIYSRDGIILL